MHWRLSWSEHPPAHLTEGTLTVGNFDGVHRGHRVLLDSALAHGRPTVVITFDPPPTHLLYPAASKVPLMTVEDRAAALHAAGVDHVVTLRTEAALLALSPEAFFEDVIVTQFRARWMIEGENFRFGRDRAGDLESLHQLGVQFGVGIESIPNVLVDGAMISSSRIRQALQDGELALAVQWLGRPYRLRGTVGTGAQRGRTLGFPTANLHAVPTLVPAVGVYAGWATTAAGSTHRAAINIGPNPTFGEDARKIEVHLLDFQADLYGQTLMVDLTERLRATQPFPSVEALRAQLQADIAQTRRVLPEVPTS
ncbi:MAG: bifunctional riboflavin kinase/FAD synthetase [Gemmataceae bacterium]